MGQLFQHFTMELGEYDNMIIKDNWCAIRYLGSEDVCDNIKYYMFEEGKYVKQGLDFKVIDIKDIGERHFISYAQNMLKNGQDLIVNCDAHYEMWDSNFDKKQSGHIVLLNDIDDHIATITDPYNEIQKCQLTIEKFFARCNFFILIDNIKECKDNFNYADLEFSQEGIKNVVNNLSLFFEKCKSNPNLIHIEEFNDFIDVPLYDKLMQGMVLHHNITKYCSEDTTALKKYLLEGREEFSKVRGLVNTVLITSDKTLTSYLSEVNRYMQQLADDGILSMTSENDIDIANMDESPNALFVIVPDERFTRHRFVTLFLTQTYKELVEKANTNLRKKETDTAILKRRAYFILDEFGNLPKMENIEGMVTVGRSRGIRYLFVLQSFSQLNAKYGRDIADILKSNCKEYVP